MVHPWVGQPRGGEGRRVDACMEVDGRVGERRGNIYIYIGYQHGQAIQLLSVIMLHDWLRLYARWLCR